MGKGFKVGLGFAGELSRNLIHTWLEQAKAQGRVWVRLTWAFSIQVEKVVKKRQGGNGVGGDSAQPVYLISHIVEIGLILCLIVLILGSFFIVFMIPFASSLLWTTCFLNRTFSSF